MTQKSHWADSRQPVLEKISVCYVALGRSLYVATAYARGTISNTKITQFMYTDDVGTEANGGN